MRRTGPDTTIRQAVGSHWGGSEKESLASRHEVENIQTNGIIIRMPPSSKRAVTVPSNSFPRRRPVRVGAEEASPAMAYW